MTDVYTAPKSELDLSETNHDSYQFFPSSQTKLLTLWIATFGIYLIYWFYKNWKIQQKISSKKIFPVLRAIFYIFFTYSLFVKIDKAAKEKKLALVWYPKWLAFYLVALSVLSNILNRISWNSQSDNLGILDAIGLLLVFVILYPIYRAQSVVNKINNDEEGKLNNEFSLYNIIFICIGAMWWCLVIIGYLIVQFNILEDGL